MSEFITGIETNQGTKKYDYNALGNLPLPFVNLKATLIVDKKIETDEDGNLPDRVIIEQRDNGEPLNLKAFIIQTDIKNGVSYNLISFNNTNWGNGVHIQQGIQNAYTTYFITEDCHVVVMSSTGYSTYVPDKNIGGNVAEKMAIPATGMKMSQGTFIKVWELSL